MNMIGVDSLIERVAEHMGHRTSIYEIQAALWPFVQHIRRLNPDA